MRKCRNYSFRKQKKIDWSLHYRQLYFCLHSLGHPQFVSLAKEEVDWGLQHLLHLPSRTQTCSSSTRAQGTARRTPHGAAPSPSPSQSSSPVVESLVSVSWSVRRKRKEWKERERDEAQRIQRESADNMRRGQQAQPHSSHTTRRHPRKEGTQRQQPPTMQEEKTSTTISPSSFPQSQGSGQNPAATTQRTRSKRTLIHP
ncbi:hypothetical protein TcCL_ESM07346 [Trypanosoma cruzi]|nr:hypothetical protein TcCL_ESM07346 [Trypanosoma cruzi]